MRITRHYTTDSAEPLASLPTRFLTIEICHSDPERRLCIPDFEVPSHWSREAAEHLAHHYIRRTGVPAMTRRVAEDGVPEWLQRSVADTDALAQVSEKLRYGSEISYRQVVHRLVGAWTYWGWSYGYFDTQADAKAFYDEHCHLIAMQQAMPASPQWRNTGLHWAYGIAGDASGAVYVDARSGELRSSKNAYERPQHHHCFIQGVSDDLSGEGGITDLWQREMRVFKHGSGSGCNLSAIRGSQESLSSGLPSAGLVPFLEIGERAAESLAGIGAPDGRASSKLSLVDIDHPDFMTLLRSRLAKHHEALAREIGSAKLARLRHELLAALRDFDGPEADRFDPTRNDALGEAVAQARRRNLGEPLVMRYLDELRAGGGLAQGGISDLPASNATPVAHAQGHNVRIGLRLGDDFLRAACHEQPWRLKSRTARRETASYEAGRMFDDIAYFNWACGDGVIQFSDNIRFWHGCATQGEIRASSPGGEFLFLDDSACDVASINLAHYVSEEGGFDIAGFEHTVRLQTIMCDIAITMAQFPSAEIAYNTYRYRPIGLSLCNLSAMLIQLGYAYDSAEGRSFAAAAAALMTGAGYVASAEIARELGGFEAFADTREGMMRLMWQHHEAAFGRTQHLGTAEVRPMVLDHATLPDVALGDAVQRVWDQAMIQGDEFGYSNAQISLVSASPNVLILMDALAPGIDPVRGLAGREQRERWVQAMQHGLARLGYQQGQIAAIRGYVLGHRSCLDAPYINAETLQEKGFLSEQLALVEDALQAGQDVHAAFDPLHLGERFCRDVLHLGDRQLYDADFKLLHHLGFGEEAVEAFARYCNGHDELSGAPFLRQEDLAIFASADTHSEQPVSVEAQIQMAASVQPYISGGIAATIETPAGVSVRQHRRWMMMAWQLGLKQIDLCRAVQPDALLAPPEEEATAVQTRTPQPAGQTAGQTAGPKFRIQRCEIVGLKRTQAPQPDETQVQRGARPVQSTVLSAAPGFTPLANRRTGYVQHVRIGGVSVCHRTEEYPDGRLGAVRLHAPALEPVLQQALKQTLKGLSAALQHGLDLTAFASVFADERFGPHGEVEGHAQITTARSVLDYIMQDLLAHYGAQQEAAQPSASTHAPAVETAHETAHETVSDAASESAPERDRLILVPLDAANP